MADEVEDPAVRIERLLDRAEPRLERVFMAAIQDVSDDATLEELADLIEAGRYEEALDRLKEISKRLGIEANAWYITAGQSTAQFLANAGVGRIVFDQVNTRAVVAMQSNSLRLVSEFTAEQRRATRLGLIDGIRRGVNPIDQARTFRDMIGLTERQAAAVINYRRLLEMVGQDGVSTSEQKENLTRALRDARSDRSVLRAIDRNKPLPKAQIDSMVSRYAKRYVAYRAKVIARTEALRSVHEGVNEAYQQGFDEGLFGPDDLVREWDSSKDSRVRDTHQLLDGQKRPWGATWKTRHGVLRYPGDPHAPAVETVQCRCVLTTRIKKPELEVRHA